MRCRDVQAVASAYIDGELDEARASALRGHLRTCDACLAMVEELAAIRDAAARLEPADPPPSLWAAVEQTLAEAEIADANRSWLWLRWQTFRPRLLPAAVAVAATVALALWVARWARTPAGPAADRVALTEVAAAGELSPASRSSGDIPAGAAAAQADRDAESLFEARAREVLDADRRYQQTIDELSQLAAEERPSWSTAARAAFDHRMAAFAEAARRQAGEPGSSPAIQPGQPAGGTSLDPRRRDALYAIYQAKIEFLQTVVIDGMPELPGPGIDEENQP